MKINRFIQRSSASLLIGLTQAAASAGTNAPDVISVEPKRIRHMYKPSILETQPDIIRCLTAGMSPVFASSYQLALGKIDHTWLIAAANFVGQLFGKEADQYDRVRAVTTYCAIDVERCTPRLGDLVKEFSRGVSSDLIHLVIQALGRTEPKDLEDLARAAVLLSNGMNADERATNLANLVGLPLQHLTPVFYEVVERLTKRMSNSGKIEAIQALGVVPSQYLEDVAAMIEGVSAEMNLSDKLSVICAANSIPPLECMVFKEVFDFLSMGLSLPKKAECFREFAHVYDLCKKFWKDHNLDIIRSATWFTFLHTKSRNKNEPLWKKWARLENSDNVIKEIERWVATYALP